MTHPLHGRHLLREIGFTPTEWTSLIDLAAELKAEKKEGREVSRLKGHNIALVLKETLTRACCSSEITAVDQGAHTTFLDPAASQIRHRESVADTAGILGRFFDSVEYRDDEQAKVDTLVELSDVPVWGGPTDDWHPAQTLCGALMTREHTSKPLSEVSYVYVGDMCFNTGRSLLANDALIGAGIRIVAPKQLRLGEECIMNAEKIVAETGACIALTEPADESVAGVDFVYTDTWVFIGGPKEIWDERITLLSAYQVSAKLMAKATPNAKFMHCLPAFHNRNTTAGREIFQAAGLNKLEVMNEVFGGPASTVFDQVENHMYTIKAVMVATLDS